MTRAQLLTWIETWAGQLAELAGAASRWLPDVAGVAGVGLVAEALGDMYPPLTGLCLGLVLVFMSWRHARPPATTASDRGDE